MDVYEKMVLYFFLNFHVEILQQHFHHQDIVQQLLMDQQVIQMLVFQNLYSFFYSFVQHENNIFLLQDYVLVNDEQQFEPNDNHHYANHLKIYIKYINPISLFVLTNDP